MNPTAEQAELLRQELHAWLERHGLWKGIRGSRSAWRGQAAAEPVADGCPHFFCFWRSESLLLAALAGAAVADRGRP